MQYITINNNYEYFSTFHIYTFINDLQLKHYLSLMNTCA